MLSLHIQWQEAPGVKDPALAATWARLEIKDDSGDRSKWLTRLIRSTANGVDRGVYGPMLPLAEWIVENWWFLLHESCRVPEVSSGRRLGSDPAQRPWVQRHNLLAARQGAALPDLTIFRDNDFVALKLAPDTEQDHRIRPVQFIEQGIFLIEPIDLERVLHQFVESVLDRLFRSTADCSERLRSHWKAVCESRLTESALCSWSGALGLDPYDENELTDELIEVMESRIGSLPPKLQGDLVDSTTQDSLVSDLDWLDRALADASVEPESRDVSGHPTIPTLITAHQVGYQLATAVREQFKLPAPVPDLRSMLHQRMDWPKPESQVVNIEGTQNIGALVGKDFHDLPRIAGPPLRHWADRFRLARSLFFFTQDHQPIYPRLVTRAFTWDQRASRAFAAELLAPAQALRSRVKSVVSADEVEQLAHEFDVRPTLIEHQLRNHHLAWVDED